MMMTIIISLMIPITVITNNDCSNDNSNNPIIMKTKYKTVHPIIVFALL